MRLDHCEPWVAIAHRGEFSMVVLSIAQAAREGLPVHREAVLVGLLVPDGGTPTPMAFSSVSDLRAFVLDMLPHGVTFRAAPGESLELVRAVLREDEKRMLH